MSALLLVVMLTRPGSLAGPAVGENASISEALYMSLRSRISKAFCCGEGLLASRCHFRVSGCADAKVLPTVHVFRLTTRRFQLQLHAVTLSWLPTVSESSDDALNCFHSFHFDGLSTPSNDAVTSLFRFSLQLAS